MPGERTLCEITTSLDTCFCLVFQEMELFRNGGFDFYDCFFFHFFMFGLSAMYCIEERIELERPVCESELQPKDCFVAFVCIE
jgi:hypothetical protein